MDEQRFVGKGLERREDPSLLRGKATYTDDIDHPRTAHLAFVRSQQAHAEINDIDMSAVEDNDTVLAVYTWADIERSRFPGTLPVGRSHTPDDFPRHPVLARDVVRYDGQPIAAVVATDRYAAADAARSVTVDYDRREATVDLRSALGEDGPTVHERVPDNVLAEDHLGEQSETAAALRKADNVIERELVNNRLISSAIEPRAAIAQYDADRDQLILELTSQSPHRHRRNLAGTLGLPEQRIRVIAPRVGGGFGHKGHHHPGEAMSAIAAMDLERPVKWTATRSENYREGAHARDHLTTARIGVDDDGTIRALDVDTIANIGAYGLETAPMLAARYGGLLSGQYAIPAIHCRTRVTLTNTAPVHTYRGAGRPESVYVIERLVDAAARELGIDEITLRRRNQIPPEEFPYETPVGATYDSGEYEETLETALEAANYDALLNRRDKARENGRLIGVGLACYVESTGDGFESGRVQVQPDGGVTVYAGTHSHGQGHETTYAQIVADELGLPLDAIDIVEGDTERVPVGTGTFGSRSTVTGGSAIAESAAAIAETARQIAAARLEVAPTDIEVAEEALHVRGAPDRSIPWTEVAGAAYNGPLPDGTERGLDETTFFEAAGTAYTFGTHVAAVEVDPETGGIDVLEYVAVDDCGPRINPRIVEGQVHGGVAQGIGQAVFESVEYGDGGGLSTASMQDYAVPKVHHIPEMSTHKTVTESPHNPLGVKGIGEAGTIAAPPTLVNAVLDALAPLGVRSIDMPLTQEAVWRAIETAE
ncbi:MAG: xanthine dehydrogenase family protein molybdopterin-binding subunit [Salinirussus sp.]